MADVRNKSELILNRKYIYKILAEMGNLLDGCCKSRSKGFDVDQDEIDALNGGVTSKGGQDVSTKLFVLLTLYIQHHRTLIMLQKQRLSKEMRYLKHILINI